MIRTTQFEACDPEYEDRIRSSFAEQRAMGLIGAELLGVHPGAVDVALNYRRDLTQQHGYLHAAVVTAILDSACGYAAYTLMPPDSEVLSVEFKVNFLSPARGRRFVARGRVKRAGRTITVCTGDAFAESEEDGQERLVATMLATMISPPRRADEELRR